MVFPITELAYLISDHLYRSGPSPAGRVTDQMSCFRPTRNPEAHGGRRAGKELGDDSS